MIPRLLVLVFSFSAGALGSNIQRRGCNADNCARAVTGTRYAADVQASHRADCSSFMSVTVTPAAPTTTTTITPTSYSVVGSNAKRTAGPAVVPIAGREQKRAEDYAALFSPNPALSTTVPTVTAPAIAARQITQVPDVVPIYASACSGTARYSSACSCAGITASTTYAPTPATVTSTVYAAPSIIPVCDPANNYGLNYIGGNLDNAAILANAALDFAPQTGITGTQACCAACFQVGSGCVVFEMYGDACVFIGEAGGNLTPTDNCPYGVLGITGSTAGYPFYGVGPCAKLD